MSEPPHRASTGTFTNSLYISRTTALLVIALVVLGQYVITGWVEDYGSESNVVSHVGFAGTIVSIILAVLAIVYSYFQTIAQRQESSGLSAQLETMRHLVEDVRRSNVGLGAEVARLDSIGDKLDRALTVTQSSHDAVLAISGRIEAMAVEREKVTADTHSERRHRHDADPTGQDLTQMLLDEASDLQLTAYWFLLRSVAERTPIRTLIDNEYAAVPKTTHAHKTYFYGFVAGIWFTLADQQLITVRPMKNLPGVASVIPDLEQGIQDSIARRAEEEGYDDGASWARQVLFETASASEV